MKRTVIELRNLILNVNIATSTINKFLVASAVKGLIYQFLIGESVVTLHGESDIEL